MSKGLSWLMEDRAGAEVAFKEAYPTACKGVEGGPAILTLSRPSKRRIQEMRYHAMINDIHMQCFRGYSAEGFKAVCVKQFAEEMEANGEPLRHPGQKVWDWRTEEAVYVRPSTTGFSVKEASNFIEFLFSLGAEMDVSWSEPSLKAYESYREAQS